MTEEHEKKALGVALYTKPHIVEQLLFNRFLDGRVRTGWAAHLPMAYAAAATLGASSSGSEARATPIRLFAIP
jgi:hypothetical protein